MPDPPKSPRSMRAFDYWSTSAQEAPTATPSQAHDSDDALPLTWDEQIAAYHHRRSRFLQSIIFMLAFFAAGVWFVWGQRSLIQYVFALAPAVPAAVDVTTITPDTLSHNTYVTVTGITEHRGMKQKFVRGITPWRKEFWYFRLLGSRGVFIEVAPNSDVYSVMTRLTVSGRVVDPAREPVYQPLLKAYQDRFFTRAQTNVRIVQVGVVPGQGRLPFVIVFAVLGWVAALNVRTVLRFRTFVTMRPGEPRRR